MHARVNGLTQRATVLVATIFLVTCVSGCAWIVAREKRAAPAVSLLDELELYSMACDDTGRIWGHTHTYGDLKLCYLDPSADPASWWIVREFNTDADFPKEMVTGADGAVYCLWEYSGERKWALSRHHGESSRTMATFGLEHEVQKSYSGLPTLVFPDSGGNVWIGLVDGGLLRISPEGEKEPVYRFEGNQLRVFGERASLSVLAALEDGCGRLWFWGPANVVKHNALRGLLIFDGGSLQYHASIQSVPDKQFSLLEPRDERSFWLGVVEDGLYVLDAQSLRAERVPEPAPGAFGFVETVFRAGRDWYVLACPAEWSPGRGTLWRLSNDSWQRVTDGITMLDYRPWRQRRAVLVTDAGVWLGGNRDGLWFVPRKRGEPVRLDWRNGMPLVSVDWLFPLDGGRLLAAERHGSSIIGTTDALLDSRKVAVGFDLLRTTHPLVQTSDGRIWGILSDKPGILSEWDGEMWTDHPIPEEATSRFPDPPRADTRDRIWTIAYGDQGHTGIYDPASDSWETYPTFEKALEAQIGHHEGFAFVNVALKSPQFSTDGRICYTWEPRPRYLWQPCAPETVRYFDGNTWRDINVPEIGPERKPGRPDADGHCFFDSADRLAINIQR